MYSYIFAGIAVAVVAASILFPISSDIPPTPAFSTISHGNYTINSTSYDSVLQLVTDDSIRVDFVRDSIHISLGLARENRPGGVFAMQCPENHYVSGISLGRLVCEELP